MAKKKFKIGWDARCGYSQRVSAVTKDEALKNFLNDYYGRKSKILHAEEEITVKEIHPLRDKLTSIGQSSPIMWYVSFDVGCPGISFFEAESKDQAEERARTRTGIPVYLVDRGITSIDRVTFNTKELSSMDNTDARRQEWLWAQAAALDYEARDLDDVGDHYKSHKQVSTDSEWYHYNKHMIKDGFATPPKSSSIQPPPASPENGQESTPDEKAA